jgi:hypothetical protein
MNHIVAVKQYTSAADMIAARRALDMKFRNVRQAQKPAVPVLPVIAKKIGLTIAPCVELPIIHYIKDTDDITQIGYIGERTQVSHVARVVSAFYGCSVIDVLSERRTRRIVEPRQVAMYLASKLTGRSTPEIGRRLGNRDHTTVLHGARKIAARIEADAAFAAKIEQISKQVMAS